MNERYRLVKGTTEAILSEFVTAAMEEGWICQGSPFFYDREQRWVQAMVRIVQVSVPAGEVRLREPKESKESKRAPWREIQK